MDLEELRKGSCMKCRFWGTILLETAQELEQVKETGGDLYVDWESLWERNITGDGF